MRHYIYTICYLGSVITSNLFNQTLIQMQKEKRKIQIVKQPPVANLVLTLKAVRGCRLIFEDAQGRKWEKQTKCKPTAYKLGETYTIPPSSFLS